MLGTSSYETRAWFHKFHPAMVRQGRDRFSGNIEIDETFLGGLKHDGKRGSGASSKTLILFDLQLDEKTKAQTTETNGRCFSRSS